MQKKPIIIISVLCVISLVLGYLLGFKDGGTNLKKEPEFLKEGLVAYYPFNGNAKDESGNGNDGEVNGAILDTDRMGNNAQSFVFDGEDDYIEIPNSNLLDLGSEANKELSISLWASVREIKENGSMFHVFKGFAEGSPNTDYSISLDNSILGWRTGPSAVAGGDSNSDLCYKSQIGVDSWHNIVVTFRNSGNPLKCIYLNGELLIKGLVGAKNESRVGVLRIGSELARGFWNGNIDDIRIYNRALSAEEVKALYEFEKAN